jgi:uncharacterized protein YqjF (DUF2071 family)
MARVARGPVHEYESVRLPPCERAASLTVRWKVGAEIEHSPGSLDDFLAERRALYSSHAGRLLRVRVRHAPWILREVSLEQLEQDVTAAAGVEVAGAPVLARFSEGTDVEVLAPEILE